MITALIIGWLAFALGVMAGLELARNTSQAGSAGIGSPDAQPTGAVEPGAGVGGGE